MRTASEADDDRLQWDEELRASVQQQIGDRIRLLRIIGSQGAELTFRARDLSSDADVVLKVLAVGPVLAKDASTRLEREAAIASRLDHPNIVAVGRVERRDSIAFYAIEAPSVATLESLLDGRSRPTFDQSLAILRDVAAALDHAHSRGVIHGRLTPASVLITEAGHTQVAGFSIIVGSSGAMEIEGGSPAYMAPEQWHTETTLDARADQYALGVLAYELISGRRRVASSNAAGVVAVDPLEVAADVPLRPGLDLRVNTAILRAVSKHRGHRHLSAGAFVEALAGDPAAAVPSLRAQHPTVAVPRRHIAILPLLLVVVAGIAVGAMATPSAKQLLGVSAPRVRRFRPPELPSSERAVDGRSRGGAAAASTPRVSQTGQSGARTLAPPEGSTRSEASRSASTTPGPSPTSATRSSGTTGGTTDATAAASESSARTAFVRVTLEAGSALVIIDGLPRGITPHVARVVPGSHTVSLRGTGSYAPAQRSVTVNARDTVTASFSASAPTRSR